MVELGHKYRVKPVFAVTQESAGKTMAGAVVYIHPKGRFAVLEFEGDRGRPRESFPLDELTDRNRILEKRKTN